ncbi:MAG TPA: hypothetical protein VFY24_11510 [Azospira sp.]|nr:hypothetical protein [Azospira sp.]
MRIRIWLALALALLASGAPAAEEVTIFESCVDGRGNSVPVVADYGQRTLVRRTTGDDGRPAIRYNPEVLPRLTPAARLFFYAGQCADSGAGSGAGSDGTPAGVRRADCSGLDTLLAAHLLQPGDLPTLAAELAAIGEADWELLPGPRRGLPASCPPAARGELRLPLADAPTAEGVARNDCVRGCGDRLWKCRKSCRGEACAPCQPAYDRCAAACGEPPATAPAR